MAAKIVLITSGQPSVNPRLVKEADTLAENGYEVLVLYAYWNHWASVMDEQLLKNKKWTAIRIGGHPTQDRLIYLISRFIHRVAELLVKKWKWNYFADAAISRGSYYLKRAAKKHPADLYIGHNLGALPAVISASVKYKKPAGFDLEDLHRYEKTDDETDDDVVFKSHIENKFLRRVTYLSASSPPTANFYKALYPATNPLVLLNVFPRHSLSLKTNHGPNDQPVKLFWFSQTIGEKRGIEDVIAALQIVNNPKVELHLLGQRSSDSFIELLNKSGIPVIYHSPISSETVIDFASQFDIGLALEPGFSKNNEFVLTNKIFTYITAGLAVIATDTVAQKQLLSTYPAIGKLCKKGNAEMLAGIINYYIQNRGDLKKAQQASLMAASANLNWEAESQKFLSIVKTVLT